MLKCRAVGHAVSACGGVMGELPEVDGEGAAGPLVGAGLGGTLLVQLGAPH